MSLSPRDSAGIAEEVARAAGRVLRERFGGKREVSLKGAVDLVTDADKAAEAAAISALAVLRPGDPVLAEERGAQAGAGSVLWIVDPLDGTTNYAHKVPHFCVSVGAVEREPVAQGGPGTYLLDGAFHRALAGAIFDPMRQEMFLCSAGGGATLDGKPLRVSQEAELGSSLFATGFPYNIWTKPEAPLALFEAFVKRARGVRRMGAAALDLAYVASGRFEGFFELDLKPWDVAAGALLVEEAGGRVSDLKGGPLELREGAILASNGPLQAPMLSVITDVLSRIR